MSGIVTRSHGKKRPPPPPDPPASGLTLTNFPNSAAWALQIEVVVAKIAEKLPRSLLDTLRPTCSTWKRNFVAELRRRRHCSVQLKNLSKGGFLRSNMSKFTDLFRSKPVSEIKFTKYSLTQVAASPQAALDFFNVCGSSIRRLKLTGGSKRQALEGHIRFETLQQELWDQVPELEELEISAQALETQIWSPKNKFRITREIPKLKRLVMTHFTAKRTQPIHQALLNELVRVAVGLEELSIKGDCTLSVGAALRDFSTNLTNLRHLDFEHLKTQDLAALIELSRRPQNQNPLRLTEFSCMIVAVRIEIEQAQRIHDFLAAQGPTLLKLKISANTIGVENAATVPIRIPQMRALKSLVILRAKGHQVPVIYDRGTLANAFPQLKKFAFFDCTVPKTEAQAYDSWREELKANVHDKVTNLDLIGVNVGELRLLDLHPLQFPALTHLRLEISSGSTPDEVSSLWTTWPALKTLRVKFRQGNPRFAQAHLGATGSVSLTTPELDLEEFLTGVPLASFLEVRRVLEPRPASKALPLELVRHMLEKYKTRPGISDLKQLQQFSLDIFKLSSTLTDIGGYLGLAVASPTLQHIRVRRDKDDGDGWLRTPASEISRRCAAFIEGALGPLADIVLK